MRAYFFDTYAFYEIIVGNPHYKLYSRNTKIITTQLNLMELYYHLLLIFSKKDALYFFNRYKDYVVAIDNSIVIKAMDFRKDNKKRKLSYADCIGYTLAKSMNVRFLTGDQQFKDINNVEYIK